MVNFLLTFLLLQGSFSYAGARSCEDLFSSQAKIDGILVGGKAAPVFITNERLKHILQGEWTPDGRLKGGLHTIEGLNAFLNFRKSLGLDTATPPVFGMNRVDAAFPSVYLEPSVFTSPAGEAVRRSYAGGFAGRYGKSLFPKGYNEKKILILVKAAVAQIDPAELRSIVGTKQFRIPLDITPPNPKHIGRFLFTLIIDENQQVITFFPEGFQIGSSLSPIMAQNQPHMKGMGQSGGRLSQLSKKELQEINDYFSKPSTIFQPIQFTPDQSKNIPLYVLKLVRSGVDLKALEIFFNRPEIAIVQENYPSLRQKQLEELAKKSPEFANEVVKYVKFLTTNLNPLADNAAILVMKNKTLNVNHLLPEINFLEGIQLLFLLERNGSLAKGTALAMAKDYMQASRKDISWPEVATFLRTFKICIDNIKSDPQLLSSFLEELPRYVHYWVLIHQPSQKNIQESHDSFGLLVQTGKDPLRLYPPEEFVFTTTLLNSDLIYQAATLGVRAPNDMLSDVDVLHVFSSAVSSGRFLSREEFASLTHKAQWGYMGLLVDRLNLQIEAKAFSMTKSSAPKDAGFPTEEVFNYYKSLALKNSSVDISSLVSEQLDYFKNELQVGVDQESVQNLNISFAMESVLPTMSYPRFQIKKLSALTQNDPQLVYASTRKIYFQFGYVGPKQRQKIIPIWTPIAIPDDVGGVRFAW